MWLSGNIRQRFISRFATALLLVCTAAAHSHAQSTPSAKPAAKRSAPSGRGMTQADVTKIWKLKQDGLLMNQIRIKGLGFEPEEDWVMMELPKTGVKLSEMPKSAAALKEAIPPAPAIDAVTAAAPGLLTQAKESAQKREVKQLDLILHPELAKDKAKVYVLFDVANYRGHTLGLYAPEPNRQASVQFFELTSSQVETVSYVYFSLSHGKIVLRDVRSGPDQAERFLKDEETVAQSKLELMFRALNDGDETGVKKICTDGLYQNIKEWGGDKHPGDRLTHGHKLDTSSVKMSVPLDQKSVRVVARISYPLNAQTKVEFDVDFERIGTDLKIVRVRDSENRIIVYDPNMDNYLNRRYGLPDLPVPDPSTLAMTEQIVFLSFHQLEEMAIRALSDHNKDLVAKMAQTLAESDPSSGIGQGFRAGANLLAGKYDEAEKDATFALQHGATVYYAVEHHLGNMVDEKFAQVVLGISKTKIRCLPAPGRGAPDESDIGSVRAKFDKGMNAVVMTVKPARPFLSVSFGGRAEGKSKSYNFAALGTTCSNKSQTSQLAQGSFSFAPSQGADACGIPPTKAGKIIFGHQLPPTIDWDKAPPIYLPPNWQRELTVVQRTIEEAGGSTK